jgi:hypothetical protein
MKAKQPLAIGKIILPLGILVLIISNIILVHEVIKLKKTSQIQSTIEARRVALMVIYQKVLTNNTKEIAELKIRYNSLERKYQNLLAPKD